MLPITIGTLVPSLLRTYVPLGVGTLLGLFVTLGLLPADLVAEHTEAMTALAVVATSGAYYTVLRLLERKWPQVGLLLGSTQQPVYLPGQVVADSTGTVASVNLDPANQ